MPDIAAAVAVEIDGVFVIFRRQELRQAHGARPRALHVSELDGAVVQHFEREQELAAEFVLALAEIGLRRQHANGVVRQCIAAVVGLTPKDREHDGRIDAELALDRRQGRAILVEQFAALRGQPIECRFFQIVRRRLDEFRLSRPRMFGPAGYRPVPEATNPARARVSPCQRWRATRRVAAPAATTIAAKPRTPHRRRCRRDADDAAQQGGAKHVRDDSHRPGMSPPRRQNAIRFMTLLPPVAAVASSSESSDARQGGR